MRFLQASWLLMRELPSRSFAESLRASTDLGRACHGVKYKGDWDLRPHPARSHPGGSRTASALAALLDRSDEPLDETPAAVTRYSSRDEQRWRKLAGYPQRDSVT